MAIGLSLADQPPYDKDGCGDEVKVFLDTGYVTLICSLPVHEDNNHYDGVFFRGWSYHDDPA